MSESIWEKPYLPVQLGECAAIQGDENGRVSLWVEGHGVTLTNEETTLLLRVLCPTQAQVDADYDQMFAACDKARASFSSMSSQWARIARYWKARAEAKDDAAPAAGPWDGSPRGSGGEASGLS